MAALTDAVAESRDGRPRGRRDRETAVHGDRAQGGAGCGSHPADPGAGTA